MEQKKASLTFSEMRGATTFVGGVNDTRAEQLIGPHYVCLSLQSFGGPERTAGVIVRLSRDPKALAQVSKELQGIVCDLAVLAARIASETCECPACATLDLTAAQAEALAAVGGMEVAG